MNKKIQILGGVFLAQLALFAFLQLRGVNADFSHSEPLLAGSFSEIDALELSDGDGKVLKLIKEDDKWVLPDKFGVPVNQEKLAASFAAIFNLKASWPVGRTMIAAKQFELVADKFERKIEFKKGDKLVHTVYIGSSPSYKKVHLRVDGSENSYSVDLNTHDFALAPTDWMSRKLYQLDRSSLAKVELNTIVLSAKKDSDFVLEGLKEGEVTNATAVGVLLNRLAPRFEDILAVDTYDNIGAKYLEYTVTTKTGVQKVFSYFALPSSDLVGGSAKDKPTEDAAKDSAPTELLLKVSDLPYYFKVPATRVEELSKAKREQLVKPKDSSLQKGSEESNASSSMEADSSFASNEGPLSEQ